MGKRTPPETLREVRRLLTVGLMSHEHIARLLKVSHNTVSREARHLRWKASAGSVTIDPLNTYRCPGCGGLVEGECRLCKVRRMKRIGIPVESMSYKQQIPEPSVEEQAWWADHIQRESALIRAARLEELKNVS